jgi:Leucine-rich repeat (LRR) protein
MHNMYVVLKKRKEILVQEPVPHTKTRGHRKDGKKFWMRQLQSKRLYLSVNHVNRHFAIFYLARQQPLRQPVDLGLCVLSRSDNVHVLANAPTTPPRQPVELGQCVLLRYLNLSSNKLAGVPGVITVLRGLQRLDISHNMLQGLPGDIGSLSNLVELNVSGNRIERIPPSIGLCSQVQS